MRRRQYLASFATLSTVAVAGCSGDEEPEETPTEEPPETPTDDDDETDDQNTETEDPEDTPTEQPEITAKLFDALEERGIDVDYLDVEGRWVVLEYNTDAEAPEELDSDASTVALAYAEHVDDFDGVEGIEAWAIGPDGGLVGRFHAEAGWAQAFADGDSTEDGYLAEVHGTIQA